MRPLKESKVRKEAVLFLLFLLLPGKSMFAQDYRLGVFLNPLISWFNTDIVEVRNEGSRAGINLNLTVEKYLSDRFSVVGGMSLSGTGGRTVSRNPVMFRFPGYTSVIAANNPVIYKIRYLSIPVGIKFKTYEMGLFSYWGEFGFDPKIVVRGRVDIPSIDIDGQKAMSEIKRFNIGYHLHGGIDYSIDGSTSLVVGLGFESNMFDITKDIGDQETDRTSHKFLKFVFGVNFEL